MSNLSYDQHAFAGRRARPVSRDTGISFDDAERFHTFQHKQAAERKLATPYWAVNNAALRELLVAYMEKRAGIRGGTGTLRERLGRARQAAISHRTEWNKVLDRLCRKYVAAKRPKRKRALQIEIEGLDTTLRVSENGAAVVAAVIYLYYRVGLDSPGVAEILRLKPPHVRMVLHRMRRIAAQLGALKLQNWRNSLLDI